MSLETITLTRIRTGTGNVTKTLAEWGITGPEHRCGLGASTSSGEDSFSFLVKQNPASARDFAQWDRIELRNEADVRFHVGWLLAPNPTATGQTMEIAFRTESAERYLRSTFEQAAVRLVEGSPSTVPNSTPSFGYLGAGIPSAVTEVLDGAIAHGNKGGAAPFSYDGEDIIPDVGFPEISFSQAEFGQALDGVLKLSPQVLRRWNCAGVEGADVVMEFVRVKTYDHETAEIFTTPQLSGAGSLATHTSPLDGSIFDGIQPSEANTLLWRYRHRYEFEMPMEPENPDNLSTYIETMTVVSDVENGSIRSFTDTFRLRGKTLLSPATETEAAVWNSAEGPPETPEHLVRLLHEPFTVQWWNLKGSTTGTGLHWEWVPGNLIRVTGGGPEAGQWTVIQSVTRQFATGKVSITTGHPSQRGDNRRFIAPSSPSISTVGNKEAPGNGGGQSSPFKKDDPENLVKPGPPGTNATVSVGDTETLEPDEPAYATPGAGSTPSALIVDFGIPRGTDAVNPNYSFEVEETAGPPSLSVTGTYPDISLTFYLRRGEAGVDGETPSLSEVAITGTEGPSTGSFEELSPGVYKLNLSLNIPDIEKGDPGEPGIPGEPGAPGADGEVTTAAMNAAIAAALAAHVAEYHS